MASFTGVKVFSTTLARDREQSPRVRGREREVTQSPTRSFTVCRSRCSTGNEERPDRHADRPPPPRPRPRLHVRRAGPRGGGARHRGDGGRHDRELARPAAPAAARVRPRGCLRARVAARQLGARAGQPAHAVLRGLHALVARAAARVRLGRAELPVAVLRDHARRRRARDARGGGLPARGRGPHQRVAHRERAARGGRTAARTRPLSWFGVARRRR